MQSSHHRSGTIPVKALRRQVLLAVAMIVLGQLNLITHLLDAPDAHSNHCLVCVQLQTQSHGVIPAGIALPLPAPAIFFAVPELADAARSFPDIPGARAPPALYFS